MSLIILSFSALQFKFQTNSSADDNDTKTHGTTVDTDNDEFDLD